MLVFHSPPNHSRTRYLPYSCGVSSVRILAWRFFCISRSDFHRFTFLLNCLLIFLRSRSPETVFFIFFFVFVTLFVSVTGSDTVLFSFSSISVSDSEWSSWMSFWGSFFALFVFCEAASMRFLRNSSRRFSRLYTVFHASRTTGLSASVILFVTEFSSVPCSFSLVFSASIPSSGRLSLLCSSSIFLSLMSCQTYSLVS